MKKKPTNNVPTRRRPHVGEYIITTRILYWTGERFSADLRDVKRFDSPDAVNRELDTLPAGSGQVVCL